MKLRMFIWALVLIPVHSVISEACIFPPATPGYFLTHSWPTGPRVVQVHIDNQFSPAVRDQLRHGAFNWNVWGLVDCSFVEFAGGGSQQFGPEVYDNSYLAAPDHVYIIKVSNLNCRNNGCLSRTIADGRTVGAKIKFDFPTGIESHLLSIGYYSWASSHEIGHTFALDDHYGYLGGYPGANVMSG